MRCPAVSWNRHHSHRTRQTYSSSQQCTDQVDICDYTHHPSDHGGIVILIRQLDLTGHASQSRKGKLAVPIRTANTLCPVHRRLSDWAWCQDPPHTSHPKRFSVSRHEAVEDSKIGAHGGHGLPAVWIILPRPAPLIIRQNVCSYGLSPSRVAVYCIYIVTDASQQCVFLVQDLRSLINPP